MIEKAIIISLIVMAIWATMWKEEIFGFIRIWGEKNLIGRYKTLQKPLYDCPICMTPWYGSGAYWIIWGNGLKEWLVVIIAAMGLNVVFLKLFPDE